MAQFFGSENIPSPVVASTTTLTLAATNLGLPTVFLVGGQAYTPSGTITLNTATTGANGLDTGALSQISLYYIYAIVNNSTFVPALVASLAVPSTGPSMPSGYGSAFKLVGAFYTNGSSQVGSIVTITGTATSGWVSFNPTGSWTTNTTYTGKFRRTGPNMEAKIRLVLAGAPNSATVLTLDTPLGLTLDTASLLISTRVTDLGKVSAFTVGGYPAHGIVEYDTTQPTGTLKARYLIQDPATNQNNSSMITTTAPGVWTVGNEIEIYLDIPITGWNASLL